MQTTLSLSLDRRSSSLKTGLDKDAWWYDGKRSIISPCSNGPWTWVLLVVRLSNLVLDVISDQIILVHQLHKTKTLRCVGKVTRWKQVVRGSPFAGVDRSLGWRRKELQTCNWYVSECNPMSHIACKKSVAGRLRFVKLYFASLIVAVVWEEYQHGRESYVWRHPSTNFHLTHSFCLCAAIRL